MEVAEAGLTHGEKLEQLEREPRPEKVAEVERLQKVIEESRGVFLTDFRGINVERMNDLRSRFREKGVEYRIVKNSLLRRAAEGAGLSDWIADLEGPTAIAVGIEDPVAPAKVIRSFREEFKREADYLTFKGGLLAGEIIDEAVFTRLATLPDRDELVSRLLYLLTYPMRGLVTVLSGVPRGLVYALEDLRRKRAEESGEGEAAGAPEAEEAGTAPEAEAAGGAPDTEDAGEDTAAGNSKEPASEETEGE